MRPIIGVNGDCLWLCGDVCHSPPSLSAPRSHGKLRSMLTGTGVGSNFRFVSDLELKPAQWLEEEPTVRRFPAAVNRYSQFISSERLNQPKTIHTRPRGQT